MRTRPPTPGGGLQGDRYAAGIGHWSSDTRSGRDLTLIEAEVIESLRSELELALGCGRAASECRHARRGVRPNDLVGARFRIGPLLVYGTRLCEPCEYLVEIVGAPILAPLVHCGGLCVDVLTSGELIEGAKICVELPSTV